MAVFNKKSIHAMETVGEKLRQHREAGRCTLNQAARKMNVNPKYLQMIESDNFEKLPAGIYVSKILGQYAKFLELNQETVFIAFEEQKKIVEKLQPPKKIKELADNWLVRIYKFILKPATMRNCFFSLIILAVLTYLGTSVKQIFTPPELIIKNPSATSIITEQRELKLEGITEKEVELTINGKQVLCDQNGYFSVELDLQTGLNIIKISAKKKHSQPRIIYRQIIVKDKIN